MWGRFSREDAPHCTGGSNAKEPHIEGECGDGKRKHELPPKKISPLVLAVGLPLRRSSTSSVLHFR